jgi:hypothetical protein
LTPEIIAGIYLGTITSWDDSTLKAANLNQKNLRRGGYGHLPCYTDPMKSWLNLFFYAICCC